MAKPRVLLVHDEGVDDAVEALLDVDGSVVTVEHVDSALEWMEQTEFDCIVSAGLDPEAGAADLIEHVQSQPRTPPYVFYADEPTVGGVNPVSNDFLRAIKRDGPTSVTQLQRTVNNILNGGEPEHVDTTSSEQLIDDPKEHAPTAEELAATLEDAPIGVTITDPTLSGNPIVYVNDAYEELTGYDKAEVLGRDRTLLQGPETDPSDIATLEQAIESRESTSVEMLNYQADGSAFWNRVTVTPLYNEDESAVKYWAYFQEDVSTRREAEQRAQRRASALHDEKRTLDDALSRVQTVFENVTTAAMNASNVESLLSDVLEGVDAVDGYRGGWISTVNHQRGDPVAVVTDGTSPMSRSTRIRLDTGGPIAEAYHSQDIITSTAPEITSDSLDPVSFDATTLVSVPLLYRNTVYGILGVYIDRALVGDEREISVMKSLGTLVGGSYNAVQTRRALHSDMRIELEFQVCDPSLLLPKIAAALDTSIQYKRLDTHVGDIPRLHLTVHDPPEDIRSLLTEIDAVDTIASVIDHGDQAIISVDVTRCPIIEVISDHGLEITDLEATAGEVHVELTALPATEIRRVVNILDDHFADVSLISQRKRSGSTRTPGEFISTVRNNLTDRQYAALETAYQAGYFEWPRPVEGEDLADSMGITRQTFHQHLRTAQRKLISAFFPEQTSES